MTMTKAMAIAIILLMIPTTGPAQGPGHSDWAKVETLPPDTTIVVGARGARRWKCQLVAVDEGSLTCHSQTSAWPFGVMVWDRTLARDQIRWVAVRGRSVVPYFAGAAALLGFAAGASANETNAGDRVVLGVLIGGALGFFGYFIGNMIELSRDIVPARHIYDKS